MTRLVSHGTELRLSELRSLSSAIHEQLRWMLSHAGSCAKPGNAAISAHGGWQPQR